MTEILTESFCERCGTRYTFETVAPRQKRLGGLKTLGRGLKTFVLSDDTSLDEALASARSDDEREITSHQLDAFHKTFNFCMNCRQYTCANCWNPIEARCLSCAPRADQVLGEAPLQLAVAGTLEGLLGPSEPALAEPALSEPALAWPADDHEHEHLPEPDLEPAATEWQLSDDILRRLGSVAGTEAVAQTNGVERDVEELMATPAEPTMAAAPEEEPSPSEILFETAAAEAAAEAAAATEATARAAAEETTAMLGRFRPGQSLDDEIAAYEATVVDEVPAPEAEMVAEPVSVADEAEPVTEIIGAEPERLVAEVEPAPQPELVLDAQWERVGAEAEPPELVEPEPVAAEAEPSPEPPAPAPRRDVVEQPAWPRPSVPTAAPGAEPQWPTGPRWPTAIPARPTPPPSTPPRPAAGPPALTLPSDRGAQATASSDPLAFLSARRAGEAMWAASAQDVLAPAGPAGNVPTGVRSCVSCGLSLSATARFCRRCGTRQDEG